MADAGNSTVRLGNHELLIRLAAGGAANVFLVRDTAAPAPGRLLALKILLPSLAANEDFLNMFFSEAKIAARLEHPNVVAIAGFGQVEGIHCLAMEYVFGASLAQVLRASARARKPLTVGVLLRITACICDALHYAHELKDELGKPMGIVHRDVTPQNILIGFNGVPKLTDFGIAKATGRGWETQAGIVKGKFSYMSPEQAMGKKVDRRSDIFGAGIVLWEALTGRDLFRGSTPLEVLTAIREQKIEPPSKVVPGLTPIVDPIVMKALRRSPRARYQTALEMRLEIEELIHRAGVVIDSTVISREFAAIYGEEIAQRALALRQAMAGKADADQLATALGGVKLSPKHLPVIPGGLTHPDPLGLFSAEPPSGEREPAKLPTAMPARVDQSFTFPAQHEPFDDLEIVESPEPADQELAEVARLEPEVPKLRAIATGAKPEGWDDSTAMSVPNDELLSMISENDATVGYLPKAFADRFGQALKRALEETQDDPSFDDELTVGMPGGPELAKIRSLKAPDEDSAPWARAPRPPPTQVRRWDGNSAGAANVPISSTRSLRPMPRAPSLDLNKEKRGGRPVPRAPSLDMDGTATPLPEVEEDPARYDEPPLPSRPPPSAPPPPPPPRIGSSSEESSPMPARISDSRPNRPALGTLAELDPPSMPGMPVLDPLNGSSDELEAVARTTPGTIEGNLEMPGDAVGTTGESPVVRPNGTGNGALRIPQDATDAQPLGMLSDIDPFAGDELPPLDPLALQALEEAARASPGSSPRAEVAAPPMHEPLGALAPAPQFVTPISKLHPAAKKSIQLTPGLLIALIVGLLAAGMALGMLLRAH